MEKPIETQNTTESSEEEEQRPRIFVTGLSYKLQDHPLKLLAILKKHIIGAEEVEILENKDRELPGYGILYLSEFKYLSKAMKVKKIVLNKNRTLLIKSFKSGKQLKKYLKNKRSRTLYVSQIPKKYKSDDLIKAFQKFGRVEQAIVHVNKTDGKSKGFGKVIFMEKKIAVKTAEEDCYFFPNGEKCYASLLKPGEEPQDNQEEGNPKEVNEDLNLVNELNQIKPKVEVKNRDESNEGLNPVNLTNKIKPKVEVKKTVNQDFNLVNELSQIKYEVEPKKEATQILKLAIEPKIIKEEMNFGVYNGGARILGDLNFRHGKIFEEKLKKENEQIIEEKIEEFFLKNKLKILHKLGISSNEERSFKSDPLIDHEFKPSNWRYYEARKKIWEERDARLKDGKYRINHPYLA